MYESNNASESTPPPTFAATVPPKTSRLAVASLVLALSGFLGLWLLVVALPAILCGVIALIKITRSNGVLKGKGFAIIGILIPMIIFVLLLAMLPALGKVRVFAQKNFCYSNLKGLGIALQVYAHGNDGKLPTADTWCDLLMSEADVSPKSFICPSSDAAEGQSSYAINRNASGKRLRDLPADMVLLFEVFPDPRRRNPSGGPESITTEHHKGDGCNVLFADGHVQFVPADQLHTLRWTAD